MKVYDYNQEFGGNYYQVRQAVCAGDNRSNLKLLSIPQSPKKRARNSAVTTPR
jgi:hypothetical protein